MRSFGPLLALLSASCLLGCDLPDNLGDLGGSLLNPDAALLETPGRQLAKGHYSRLELDGSLESGGWVVAKRHDLETDAVSIVSFLGDGQCELEGATDFQRVSSRIDVALPGLIAFQRGANSNGIGTVEFAGFDCQPKLEPVPESPLPSLPFPRSSPRGLLMLTASGRLLLVDVANQSLQEVATNVSSGRSEGNRLWLIKGQTANRELVVFDENLDQKASWPGVTELLVLSGDAEPSAVIRDSEGLHFVSVASGEKELISPDGCAPVSLGTQALAFFDPCEERHLRLSVLGQLVGRDEERFTIDIGPHVIAHHEIIPYWQGKSSYILYQVNSENGSIGELRVAEALGEDPENRTDADYSVAPQSRVHRSNIFVDWNGTSGTLVTPRLKSRDGLAVFDGLEPVATGVAQLPGQSIVSDRGALINYDGQLGDLVRFSRTGNTYHSTQLATGVPIQTQALEPTTGAFAFVGDLGRNGGTPFLVLGDSAQPIGANALPSTLRFLEQPRAVAYLAREGSNSTATLNAWLIESELEIRVSTRVSEYRELPWPSAGLLYAIPSGDRAGLWFARAR